jgi:hypothetical protein
MLQRITKGELFHAQIALAVAISLQVIVWKMNDELLAGPQYLLLLAEVGLAVLISFTVNMRSVHERGLNHLFAVILLGLISAANVSSLMLVLHALIVSHAAFSGPELLTSAVAILLTNVIVYALWYWEIDSPGLSRKRWSKHDKDFQFTQQDLKNEFSGWRPQFFDYLYLSITNAINFASADARPLTHAAKMLMGSQALISVLTLALVLARSVSILGT